VTEFRDFEIRIGKRPTGYRACVSASFACHDFPAPFSEGELDAVLARSQIFRDLKTSEAIPAPTIADLGANLFDQVFGGEVRRAWDEFQGEALSSDGSIRLCLLLEDTELWEWPWEFLRDSRNDFLALSPRISIVRCPAPLKPLPSRRARLRPRVLFVNAHPRGSPKLSFEHEWKSLAACLEEMEKAGRIDLDRIEHATLSNLRVALKRPWDVLHFVGHGTFGRNRKEGVLLFEKENGEGSEVSGRVLARVLRRQEHPPRLIVLNACQGGRAGQDDPFDGVAQRLVREGVAAVVAMQFKVSDKAALAFSEAFYEAFAQGAPVDRAVYEGRLALLAEDFETEWGTPVLYLRSPDVQLNPAPEPEPLPLSPPQDPIWKRWMKAVAVGSSAIGVLSGAYWALSRPVTASDPACPSPPELGMFFVKIEPGELLMGRDQRRVKITRPFCMSRYEITQKQWKVMTGLLPDQATVGEDLPVGNVSWLDVQDFLAKLNRKDRGAQYRLPTEAQWEYAARAGTSGRFSFDGDETDLPRYGNCGKSGKLTPAGSFRKNRWGLYDMYGNVSEWVADWDGPLPEGSAVDPTGPVKGTEKVRRGGSFEYEKRCDSIYRNSSKPETRDEAYGFRIIRDPIP
jgi:formylglycine-generating enzyme required for sulfatase activity